jgi:hypothetical protein
MDHSSRLPWNRFPLAVLVLLLLGSGPGQVQPPMPTPPNPEETNLLLHDAEHSQASSEGHRLYFEGNFEAARQKFRYAEKARARALLDLLVEAKSNIRKGIAPEQLQQEHAILRRIAKIHKALLAENLSEKEVGQFENQLRAAEQELARFRAYVRLTSPAYAALQYPEPYDLRTVQKTVVNEKGRLRTAVQAIPFFFWKGIA